MRRKLTAFALVTALSCALLLGCGDQPEANAPTPTSGPVVKTDGATIETTTETSKTEVATEAPKTEVAINPAESVTEAEPTNPNASPDILVSWTEDSKVKADIIAFVEAATNPDNEGYIPAEDRIVVSDIDGTLIPEKGAKINNDSMTPYSPTECREYLESIKDKAFDEKKGYVYGDMLYAPMKEMFDYLYANDFDIYFVSGNYGCLTYAYANYYFGADYLHCVGTEPQWSNEIDENGNYSVIQNQYDMKDGNWGDRKAYRFWDKVGKIPVLGFGNSDGDVQLLQWTVSNPNYPSLGIMINHDDEREYVYNADTTSGFCTSYGFLDCKISEHFKEIQ